MSNGEAGAVVDTAVDVAVAGVVDAGTVVAAVGAGVTTVAGAGVVDVEVET